VAKLNGLWVLSDGTGFQRRKVSPINVAGPAQRFRVVGHPGVSAILNIQRNVLSFRRNEANVWNEVGASWIQVKAISVILTDLNNSVTLSGIDAAIITDTAEVTSCSSRKSNRDS